MTSTTELITQLEAAPRPGGRTSAGTRPRVPLVNLSASEMPYACTL